MGPTPEPVLLHMRDFDDPFSTAGDMKYQLQNLLDSKEKQLQQAGSLGQRVLAQQMELEERIRQLQVLEADKGEDDEIDLEARERYRELTDTILSWDSENAQLSSAFGGSSKRFLNGSSHSPNVPYGDLPREEPERTKASAGTSAAQSRRAKNAAHRADDVEFAFEIGSGLLTEVRRLQSLLGERDKAIQDMKEEKDDLEKTVEAIRTNLRQQEQSSDKYKEENWNLEVALQELRGQHSDSQAATQRLETEHKRLTKALALARDNADHHKNESERLQTTLEEVKNKHETDIAQARKHAAGLARDKSDLQQTIDTLKAENARAGRRLPRFGSPLTPGVKDDIDFLTPAGHDDHDSDVFGTSGGASTNRRRLDVSGMFGADDLGSDFADTPEPSPIRKPFLAANHPSNEIEVLQQRLAHAQRQINTLKGSLNREKQNRMRLEGGAGGGTVIDDDEGDENEEYVDESTVAAEGKKSTRRSTTPFKVGGAHTARGGRGRGRGRGINNLIHKLGMAANSPASEYNDDDDPNFDEAPPVPSIPIHFNGPDDEEDEVSQFFGSSQGLGRRDNVEHEDRQGRISRSPSPSPLDSAASNRTSVDGMDPAFANVLRRVPSNGSYAGSPLRQTVLGRSARGGAVPRRPRGGVPFKEARPPSIVDAPEVLAAELGGVDSSPMKSFNASLLNETEIPEEEDDDEEYIKVKKVEKVEFGCQTEALEEEKTIILPEPPIIVPEPVPVLVLHSEMSVQSDPEPEPVLPPKAVMLEMALQTEPEPIVAKFEMAVQCDAPQPVVPAPLVLVESGVGTDPVINPTLLQAETQTKDIQPTPLVIGQRYTSHISPDSGRRGTITQADISHSSTSVGDSTITRSFLVQRHDEKMDEDEIDEGEETETGAETEEDYQDARMSTPSEDFHSLLTMTDNDYSDSEDDAESIKASRFSSFHNSTASVDRQSPIASSFYGNIPVSRTVSYETVGVGADLYEPPEPVVIKPPKPEVKEISIQTDEWKPPAPVPVPVPAVIPVAPIQSVKPIIAPAPGLYRVGSATSHQFQFIPPQPSSNGIHSPTSSILGAPSPIPTPMSSVLRDSTGTFGRRTAASDRRQSIESLISSSTAADEASSRSRVPSSSAGSTFPVAIDKTKPPMMALPPPPKLPPPPNSMPPPTCIPERRMTDGGPPPRPSSPPPPELIQRATTPLGSILSVPGVKGVYNLRQHGSSMPPSQTGLRQPPSTSSFRSAANAANYAQGSMPPSNALSSYSVRERERREFSTTSLVSEQSGIASPRSSISSDHPYNRSPAVNEPPTTPNKTADLTPRANINAVASTDPVIIHAITQTMIGEFLYKYTRRTIGKGVGERRHKRFFWVHPYTKTLYWSSADPGSSNVSESSAKSAYIEGVRSVLDPNPMPPGLYQYSVVISTPQREMKITALTKDRHDIWLNALKYLLSRPNNLNITSPANNTILPHTPGSADHTDDERRQLQQLPMTTPPSQRSPRSPTKTDKWTTTPRVQRSRSQLSVSRSASKRSGTPALEYLRWNNAPESPYSPDRSFVNVPDHDTEELDFELHGDSHFDEGFEGLENVRACCDGRHTVGHSGKIHHHHHHEQYPNQQGTINSRRSTDNQHLDPNPHENPRPSSPAWSFRSRTGSSQSHEGLGGGIFSWGRGEDGKLRFGSRRSAKSSLPIHD